MFAHPKVSSIPTCDELNALWLRARKVDSASLRMLLDEISYELIVRCFKSRKEPSWSIYETRLDSSTFISSVTATDLEKVRSFVEKICLSRDGNKITKFEPVKKVRRERAIVLKMRPQKSLKVRSDKTEEKEGFAGNLATLRIDSLLQSLAISQASGRLSLCNQESFADVFCEEGQIIHAVTSESSGEAAVLDLLTWQSGLFKFAPGKKITTLNVSNNLDKLLIKGVTLIDQSNFLTANGVTRETKFEPLVDNATLEQLLSRLNQSSLEAALTERFYKQISPERELYELIRAQLLTKSQWIPILYHLLSANMIRIASPAPPWHEEERIEFKEIEGFESQLTGGIEKVFTRQAFLYLLNREFQRMKHGGAPVSVFLITADNANLLLQNKNLCEEISSRLHNARRAADVIGMLDDGSIACALFDTSSTAASRFAQRAVNLLTFAPLTSAGAASLQFGCASAPDDGNDVFALLKAARESANSRKYWNSAQSLLRRSG